MEVNSILITPTEAKKILLQNTCNRRLRNHHVDKLAKEMIHKKWKKTGVTIQISESGRLLDGQHRLHAVLRSGISTEFIVIRGVPDESNDVIDTGVRRTNGDIFQYNGVSKNYTVIPAIINFAYAIKRGGQDVGFVDELTSQRLLELYNEREEFWNETTTLAQNYYYQCGKLIPTSLIGGFYAVFYDIDKDDAKKFMYQLCTGKSITNESICVLKNKLLQLAASGEKLKTNFRNGFIIKTWNAYRTNEEITALRVNQEEKFPVPC